MPSSREFRKRGWEAQYFRLGHEMIVENRFLLQMSGLGLMREPSMSFGPLLLWLRPVLNHLPQMKGMQKEDWSLLVSLRSECDSLESG